MAKKDTAKAANPVPQATPENQQPSLESPKEPVTLTLQDLVQVAQIIQITNQRGAYKAEEMAVVGGLYNKLVTFLESTGAINKPADSANEEK
jgi:hypothetical protein